MSRVYFHSQSDVAELWGAERAHFGCLIENLFTTSLDLNRRFYLEPHPLRRCIVAGHYLHKTHDSNEFDKSLNLAVRHGDEKFIYYYGNAVDGYSEEGTLIDQWTSGLNTALAMGNDALKFAARVHGQCEIHGYVEGKNRKWLAGIIGQGLTTGVYRKESGWNAVQKFLLAKDNEPVVMSYSVCESFPNPYAANFNPPKADEDGEPDYESWYKLPKGKQWKTAMEGLRESGGGLELTPERWEYPEFQFGDAKTAPTGFQLYDSALWKGKQK